jgi:hypothetical protein
MKSRTLTPLTLIFTLALAFMVACASKPGPADDADGSSAEVNPLVPTSFGPNYKYNELMIKDYDEMTKMVQTLLRQSRTATTREDSGGEGEAVEYLGRALKLIFSRPDSDNMVAKLVGEVRRDLQGYNSYEDCIAALAAEAVRNVQNTDGTISTQATALVILENLMGEISPAVRNGDKTLLRVVKMIHSADLKPSSEVKRDRRMRGMFRSQSPSVEAGLLLKQLNDETGKK